MNLTLTRQAIADAISTVGFSITPTPSKSPKALDGWVTIGTLSPSGFGNKAVCTFQVWVLLSPDEYKADELFTTNAVAVVNATATLPAGDVSLGMDSVAVGTNAAPFFAMVLTMTMEVS